MARYDRFEEEPDDGFDDWDKEPCGPADLRSVVDRYDQIAREIIDSMGR